MNQEDDYTLWLEDREEREIELSIIKEEEGEVLEEIRQGFISLD